MLLPAKACAHCGCLEKDVRGVRVANRGDFTSVDPIPWTCQACDESLCSNCGAPGEIEYGSILCDDGSLDEDSGVGVCVCKNLRQVPDIDPNIIAIVYGFEHVLTPHSLEECQTLPALGIDAAFWKSFGYEDDGYRDALRAGPRRMLERAAACATPLTPQHLTDHQRALGWTPGFQSWIPRINAFVGAETNGRWRLEHHLVSTCLREAVEALPGINHFDSIRTSEMNWAAASPRRVIGREARESLLFALQRRLPFRHLIMIGDRQLDWSLLCRIHQGGGMAICTSEGDSWHYSQVAVPADFRSGSELDQFLRDTLRQKLSSGSPTLITDQQGASR